MYRTTSVMALGLFLGLAPIGALAQTQTDDTNIQQQQQQLTQPSDDQQATDVETDMTTDTEADIATDEEMAIDEADVATDVVETEDVIPQQDASEMLATSLMGASVNLADESIGTVSDLIITPDYTVRGVVVGVGGFLGIGEKRVALPLERLTIRTPQPGVVEVTANVTREELEEKETFKTAAQIQQEEEAARAEQQQQMNMQQPQTFD
jgi:hypothetical protein